MAWWDRRTNRGTPVGADGAGAGEPDPAQLLFNAKTRALDIAKRAAADERPARAPNLTDYFRAALTLPELQGNPAIIADLSGQHIDGFTIRRADLQPNADERKAMRDVLNTASPDAGIRAMRNFIDADGNNTIEMQEIDQFYALVDHHKRFNGTNFTNVTFQPATTLEILRDAVGAQYGNIELQGLEPHETLTIGSNRETRGNGRERFGTVRITEAEGGTVRVNGNATIDGLIMDGGKTVLEIAPGGQVNQLAVRSESVTLKIEKGGQLFLPSFNDVTFTPLSSMEGASLRGNSGSDDRFYGFRNSNLNGISFNGASVSGITVKDSNFTGAHFRRARFSDSTVTGSNLTHVDFTGAHLHNLTVAGANFSQSNFTGAHLHGLNVSGANFSQSDLSGAHLSNVTLTGTNLSNTRFKGARLENVTLTDTNLRDADFSEVEKIENVTLITNGVRRTVHSLGELQREIALQSQATQIGSVFAAAMRDMNQPQPQQEVGNPVAFTQTAGVTLDTRMPVPDRPLEQTRTPAGGDVTLAQLGTALTQNFGNQAVSATQNDVALQQHDTAEARAALREVLNSKAEAAMADFVSRT